MNRQQREEKKGIPIRVLFCIVPILAAIFMTSAAFAAPADVEAESSGFVLDGISASQVMTHSAYMPVIFGSPISSPPVIATRPQKNGTNFEWLITWAETPGTPAEATYTVVESNSPTMSPVLRTYSVESAAPFITQQRIIRPPGTKNSFYYTVQLDGPNGLSSEPVKVVSAYRDDFNEPSGWEIRRQDFDDTDNVMSYFRNNKLKMHVRGRWDYFITSPLAEAPEPPYRIETRVILEGPGNLNTYGIIFGGDWNGRECPTIFPPKRDLFDATGRAVAEEVDVLPIGIRSPFAVDNVRDNCLNHYYRAMFLWKDGFSNMHGFLKQIQYHDDGNSGRGEAILEAVELEVSSGSANGWNDWAIEVYADGQIAIFAGDEKLITASHPNRLYINDPIFGLWASTDEYPGSDPLYDYLIVEPLP